MCWRAGIGLDSVLRFAIFGLPRSWKWAGFAWVYMTLLGYVAAIIAYQTGSLL